MNRIKWFERKFDFSFKQNIFPSLIKRLEETPLLLERKIDLISKENLTLKPNGKWSIQEHVGHLIDLEPLWFGRLEDILAKKSNLRSADLENTKTNLANHNEKNIGDLLSEFSNHRHKLLNKLTKLTNKEVYNSAIHPRLKKPMRTMDLFLFVAEHDRHHLESIAELIKTIDS